MSDVAAHTGVVVEAGGSWPLQPRLGWRNLWRNRRRTSLTAGGVAFAVLLVSFAMALQDGVYVQLEDLGTGMISGHAQVSTAAFVEDSTFIDTLPEAEQRVAALLQLAGVQFVLPRVEAFALVSVDERSFGAQILGVDIAAEHAALNYLNKLSEGRLPEGDNEAVVGSVLARNLRAGVGDELVVLGSGKYGGVAAMAFTITGLVNTGLTAVDRALVVAPISTVQEGFELQNEVHSIALLGTSAGDGDQLAQSAGIAMQAQQAPESGLLVRSWTEVLPDLDQAISLDRIAGNLLFAIILGLVSFTVVNSFVMTIFERTREFGMLCAIGMRPGQMIWLLQWESLFVWAAGTAVGLLLTVLLVSWLGHVGIFLGEAAESFAAMVPMPTHMYPTLSNRSLTHAPVVMFFGCQLASLIPALRLFRLQPVEALRES